MNGLGFDFSWHAARRILQRGLDPWDVVAAVQRCLPMARPGMKAVFRVWPLKLVLRGNVLVTVMDESRKDEKKRRLRLRHRKRKSWAERLR
jgi:hypothetical protein